MICKKCNHKLPADSEFCQYCGSKLESNDTHKTGESAAVEKEIHNNQSEVHTDVPLEVSLSSPDEKPKQYGNFAIRSEDVRLDPNPTQPQIKTAATPAANSPSVPPKKEKVRYCSLCGSQIDGNTKKCTGCGKQYFRGFKLNKFSITVLILSLALTASIVIIAYQANELNRLSSQEDCSESNETVNEKPAEVHTVGVRTITFSDKFTAEYILASWKNGEATEQSMIEIMDEYGASQGGGKLYIITRGDFIEEVDEWCFSPDRQVGDYAIIENAYGYTLCYISGFNITE